ncbi:HepT-like ribonuclease domain-containing protein [Thermanaeromonas sp.]
MLQEAVVRRLEVIAEPAKNVSPQLKEKYPDISWKEMAGMRDM